MSEPSHVLVVAHQTAATSALLDEVHGRAERGEARFISSCRGARTGSTSS